MTAPAELELRVVERSAEGGGVSVTLPEGFAGFRGHFPGEPVLPAMCHVELALRAAALLAGRPLVLTAVDRARFPTPAGPGAELRMEVRLAAAAAGALRVEASHRVHDSEVARLTLTAR